MRHSPHALSLTVGALLAALLPAAQAAEPTEPDAAVLSEITVSATRSAEALRRDASAGKLVVGRQELDALNSSSVAELLRKLPGAGIFTDLDNPGRGGRSRVAERNLPQILVDGQLLPGGGRAPATALRLPVELIERVEIIRNSTAEFPNVSPAGTINLILRDAPNRRTLAAKLGVGASQGRPSLRAEGQYGNREGGFSYLLSGSLTERPSQGSRDTARSLYSAQGETRQQEAAHSHGQDSNASFSPRFTWRLGEYGQLIVSPLLSYTRADQRSSTDIPGVSHEDSQQHDTRASARLLTEWKLSHADNGETSVKLMSQGEREQSRRRSVRPDASGAWQSQQDDTLRHEREWLASARHQRALGEAHLLTGALEWRIRSGDDRQNSGRDPSQAGQRAETRERQQVFWIQDEWQLAGQQVLTPGLRWQLDHTAVSDMDGERRRSHRAWLPSLHYLWQVNSQWNLRASASRNNRAPSIYELSPVVRAASGDNSASNPDRGGNPDLRGEQLTVLDMGIEHFLPDRAGVIGLSLFARRIDNYSQRLTLLEGERWVARPHNLGQASTRGLLFDAKAKLSQWGLPQLTVRSNVMLSRTRLRDSPLGDGPRKSANLGLDYESPAGWSVGGTLSHVSTLDRDSSLTVRQQQDANTQLDLYATYKLDRQLTMRLALSNVTGAKSRNQVWEYDSSGALQRQEVESRRANRSVLLTLEGKW